MYTGLPLSFSVAWILLLLCNGCAGKRRWDYEPLFASSTAKNASKLNVETSVDRVGRGDYAITAKIFYDDDMDESTMFDPASYRSNSGSEDDYEVLPWVIPKQTFQSFTKTFYKDILYNFLTEPDNAYPLPKYVYSFDKCVVIGEDLNKILLEGYYKIVFTMSGSVTCVYTAIVKITTKSDLIG